MIARRPRRPGFTLLEVLLASALGLLLLAGLYVAFDVTLRQADTGRQAVEQGDLSRAIVNRMTIDLSGCIGPLQPKSGGGLPQEAQTTGTASSSGSTTTAGTASGTATAGTASAGTASTGTASPVATLDPSSAPQDTGEQAADVPFQGGAFGTANQLTLFVSRVPPSLTGADMAFDPRPDLRRVIYYLGSNGGLCRQERPWVTADGVRNSVDPDLATESLDRIAPEVTDVLFEYFDGGSWASQWTGSDATTDGTTPIGPPRAVRVTLTIQPPGGTPRTIKHVIPLRAAVGLAAPPPAPEDPATAAVTGGM